MVKIQCFFSLVGNIKEYGPINVFALLLFDEIEKNYNEKTKHMFSKTITFEKLVWATIGFLPRFRVPRLKLGWNTENN